MSHEYVFWIGDLNYRIHESIPTEDVFAAAARRDIEMLRKHDQLCIEREHGRVFTDFKEEELTFMPTYKYIQGTDVYDQRVEKKIRPPAWCDRILYHSKTKDPLIACFYGRSDTLNISDHKPVSCLFHLTMRSVVEDKERVVYQDLLKMLDKWHNACIPKVEVDDREMDFGLLPYQVQITKTITLRNTGSRVAQWKFVNAGDDSKKFQSRLGFSVAPTMGMLTPGEVSIVSPSLLYYAIAHDVASL